MTDTSSRALYTVANIQGPGALCIGNGAGFSKDVEATGGAFIGYLAGVNSSSGASATAIGANSDVFGDAGHCIAIGRNASIYATDAESDCIVLGNTAFSSKSNCIVLGPQIGNVQFPSSSFGLTAQEFGGMHQFFWTRTTASGNLNLSGSTGAQSVLNGWIAFETISANATMTLPSLSDMLAQFPDIIQGSSGELIVSNFNTGGYSVSVSPGSNTYWYSTSAILPNTIQHVIWRYVFNIGFQGGDPFIEFFS